jgi:hypothetical protein
MKTETLVGSRITLISLMIDTEEELFLKRHGCTVEIEAFTCNIILPDGAVRTLTEQDEWGRGCYVIRLPDRTTLTEISVPDGKSQLIFPEPIRWIYKIQCLSWRLRSLLGW